MKPKIILKSQKGPEIEDALERDVTRSKRTARSLNQRGKSKNSSIPEKMKIINEDSNFNTEYFTSRKGSFEASKESIDNRENQELLDKKLKFNIQGTTAVSFAGELPMVGPETRSAFSTTATFGPKNIRSSLITKARPSRGFSEASNSILQASSKTSFLSDLPGRKSEKGIKKKSTTRTML
jgi:hypothetical protein